MRANSRSWKQRLGRTSPSPRRWSFPTSSSSPGAVSPSRDERDQPLVVASSIPRAGGAGDRRLLRAGLGRPLRVDGVEQLPSDLQSLLAGDLPIARQGDVLLAGVGHRCLFLDLDGDGGICRAGGPRYWTWLTS